MVCGLLAGLVPIPLFLTVAYLMSAPESGSVIGLTVDEEDRMTAAVAVCEGEADVLDLSEWSTSDRFGDQIGEWPIRADGGLRLVRLAEDGSVGRPEQLGIGLDQGAVLRSYSSARQSGSLVFLGADLQSVREGHVWWTTGGEPQLIPIDTFQVAACDALGL